MKSYLSNKARPDAVAIAPLTAEALEGWLPRQPKQTQRWVAESDFRARPGQICRLADDAGRLVRVLAGVDKENPLWSYAALAASLPANHYRIEGTLSRGAAQTAALGWQLGTYEFTRYKKGRNGFPTLVCPKAADGKTAERTAECIFLVRDLINTPASDMGPAELAAAARGVARTHKARIQVITGESLLKQNYPAIHAVGRASSQAPRLIDLRWGTRGPKITLVGKGVCFDSGGLDLKPAGAMKLMKKDMGGSAHVLGLGKLIMAMGLKVRLRVLVPAVENAVSGNAFRPLDVLQTRKGLTVEVGNTDAEGRLVLADALAEADREKPDLILDYATLTGAARVALGTDLPALFCNDDRMADALLRHANAEGDPLWRLPLHRPYRPQLDSKVADLNNISDAPFGGAITAALFMSEFVSPDTPWAHLDIMAWNRAGRAGQPEGGEAMGLRAAFALIAEMASRHKEKAKSSRK